MPRTHDEPANDSRWHRFIDYLKTTRLCGTAIRKGGLIDLGSVLGVVTTPIPIAGSLYYMHAKGVQTSAPLVGDLRELEKPIFDILAHFFLVLTWSRYHPAACRRVMLSVAAFLHNTRWEVKADAPSTSVLEHQDTLPDLDLNQVHAAEYDPSQTTEDDTIDEATQTWLEHLKDGSKNIVQYLFDCPNRYFMIRINTLLMPILMLYFVSSRGLKGSIPGFADTTELPDWIRYILHIEFSFHFGQAFTDRSVAALDIVTAKKNLLVWMKDCIQKMPQYREKSFGENWHRFITLRKKVMNNAGFYRSCGAFAGVFSGAILSSVAFGLNYFKNNGSDEKLKGFGNIEDLGGHNELIALALFYVTTSCGPRIGECIDDIFVVKKRYDTGHVAKNYYRALFTLIFVPIYVTLAIICSVPSIHKKHEWRVDLFSDTQALSSPIVFAIMISTGFNFVLPLATRFFGPIGDFIGFKTFTKLIGEFFILPYTMLVTKCQPEHSNTPPTEPSEEDITTTHSAATFTPSFNRQRHCSTEDITQELAEIQIAAPNGQSDCTDVETQLNSRLQNLKIN